MLMHIKSLLWGGWKKKTLGVYFHEVTWNLYCSLLEKSIIYISDIIIIYITFIGSTNLLLIFILLSCYYYIATPGLWLIFEVGGDVQKVARESSCRHLVNMLFFYESSQGSSLELSELAE